MGCRSEHVLALSTGSMESARTCSLLGPTLTPFLSERDRSYGPILTAVAAGVAIKSDMEMHIDIEY